MKTRQFSIAVATGLILAAPALAAGPSGGDTARTDPLPSRQQQASALAGSAQYDSPQERSMGIACPPGPIMEETADPSTGNGAGPRRGANTYYEAIEGRPGAISL